MLEFAALVHEMRDRIACIAMFSQDTAANSMRHDSSWLDGRLARICRDASELQRIINAIGRLEDDSAPARGAIDVSSLSAQILRGHVARRPSLDRVAVMVQSNIQVIGDAEEIEIVLDNLIGNALKFSSLRSIPEVRVTATFECGRTIVNVSDNGVGITQEDAERMFEPFTRCHRGYDGTGLGLAIAQRIVARHGGRIWATGEPCVGTTVSFYI